MEPVLNKQIKKVAGGHSIFLGDKEVKYDMNFRLYMTTKLANPKYAAEITTRVQLVNFQVKEQGLEEQLLSEVIKREKKELESQKNELVSKKAENE